MGLDRRIARLEERTSDATASLRLIFLAPKPGETNEEAIARQKQEQGIPEGQRCLVVQWVRAEEVRQATVNTRRTNPPDEALEEAERSARVDTAARGCEEQKRR